MRDPAFDPPQDAYDAGPLPPADARATPSMAQYLEIKAKHADCLLFYRMGDFYELFFGDAEIASRTLGIVLTRRGKHAGDDIPMCGVPVARSDDYLHRLIGAGFRVAICEQLEDPAEARKRGSKAVVRRDVVRIVTPGTITEEGLLEARRANFLAALARQKAGDRRWDYALAAADVSTGAFLVEMVAEVDLAAAIARLEPSEMIVPDQIRDDPALAPLWLGQGFALTRLPREGHDPAAAEARIASYFGVKEIAAYGEFLRPELSAMAAIIGYLERTQLGARPPLAVPRRRAAPETMAIDAATRANLELTRTLAGSREGSLIATIDRAITAGGSRLIAEWLSAPSLVLDEIRHRQAALAFLVEDGELRRGLRDRLKRVPDLARAMGRVALDRAGPRDLAAIASALVEAESLAAELAMLTDMPPLLAEIGEALLAMPAAQGHALHAALREDLPLNKRDGGFIRAGFDAVLDEYHALGRDSRSVIASLQGRYAAKTGIRNLKIRHNNLIGYYVEVPPEAGETLLKPPHVEHFIHRQTMAGTMRFSTAELGELDRRIASAESDALTRELQHFHEFARDLLVSDKSIRAGAEALARLDALAALAELAVRERYVRPDLSTGTAFRIKAGRHPVVEAALREQGGAFIANDVELSPEHGEAGRILLVTGANMAGKSTYLRQNALIAILAQMGSFVPAEQAEIGLVDRLFSRVGAADDLARGRSTFMVEMVETAAILNQASARSFVILDEIGRGTATFDGLAIAWAAIEHLHGTNRCRGLFATHFHELTALAGQLERLACVTMKVATYKGEVVFLHEVVPGAADRSYGIQVGKLAGLPPAVVKRAGAILAELEKAERASPVTRMIDDLPLFRAATREPDPPVPDAADPLHAALADLRPDEMSPREALEALYRLKALTAR